MALHAALVRSIVARSAAACVDVGRSFSWVVNFMGKLLQTSAWQGAHPHQRRNEASAPQEELVMNTFPDQQLSRVSRLRLLRNLAETALAQYDIPDAHLSYLQEGDNLLYRVRSPAQGQFLLRVHELARHSEPEIRSDR